MESNDKFLFTRFKIFGLLTEGSSPGIEVSNYQSDVDNEKKLQVELGVQTTSSEKQECKRNISQPQPTVTKTVCIVQSRFKKTYLICNLKKHKRIVPCFSEVTITKNERESKTYILKVNYDDYQYKTLVVTPETNSISVCALLASKLYLTRFTFRLFLLKNKEGLTFYFLS